MLKSQKFKIVIKGVGVLLIVATLAFAAVFNFLENQKTKSQVSNLEKNLQTFSQNLENEMPNLLETKRLTQAIDNIANQQWNINPNSIDN